MDYVLVQSVKVLSGSGSISKIGEVVKDAGYQKPCIVCGQGIKKSGILGRVVKSLEDAGISYTEFSEVVPDPPAEIINKGASVCKESGCDCVIGVGGGSAIDTAKGINVLRFNEGSILDYIEKPMKKCTGLITIPTTSGTGSELSNGAIITDTKKDKKIPLLCYSNMSEYTVLDPELSKRMPVGLTMMTGLDTFSHAAEAYTSVMANMMTDPICEKIMEDIATYLPRAVKDGEDMEARTRMHACASLGGWMLYNACAHVGHSIAHVLGAECHLIHGAACAYGLPGVLKLIAPAVPAKVKKIGEILGAEFTGNETAKEVGVLTANAYVRFRDETLGLQPVTQAWDGKTDIGKLVKEVSEETFIGLAPVKVTKEETERLVREALGYPKH